MRGRGVAVRDGVLLRCRKRVSGSESEGRIEDGLRGERG